MENVKKRFKSALPTLEGEFVVLEKHRVYGRGGTWIYEVLFDGEEVPISLNAKRFKERVKKGVFVEIKER